MVPRPFSHVFSRIPSSLSYGFLTKLKNPRMDGAWSEKPNSVRAKGGARLQFEWEGREAANLLFRWKMYLEEKILASKNVAGSLLLLDFS